MIKRTLYFGNPAYLKTKDEQLVFESTKSDETKAVPIANIAVIKMKHQQTNIVKVLLVIVLLSNVIVLN